MRLIRPLTVTLLAALLVPTLAHAQAQRIGVVNAGRVLNELQEFKDFNQKRESDAASLNQQGQQRQQKLRQLGTDLQALRQGTPQYEDKAKEALQLQIESKNWFDLTRAEQERQGKEKLLELFTKMQDAVAQVAKERGLDLVLAQQGKELPPTVEQLNVQQLEAALGQRNVLYVGDKVDISSDVIAKLDAAYKAK
ncbi:MAG TPA: OmpH family outer membrane protein [Tepidisphaeraceae bacterium]|nr:OmpH family outer membrane protein [Tepidisphaeraceae bacterium]